MDWSHKRGSFLIRSVAILLAFILLGSLLPIFTFASSAPSASSPDSGVGANLYSVSTALTQYANDILGPNTNDKHVQPTYEKDDGSFDYITDSSGRQINHKIYDLNFDIISMIRYGDDSSYSMSSLLSEADVGDAGAIVGYGDPTRGFRSNIASTSTSAITSSGYGAYVDIGDNSKTYAYLRYGRLLTDLGLSQTRNPAKSDVGRRVGGIAMQGGHVLAAFTPAVFELAIKFLQLLNPFRFLVHRGAVAGTITDVNFISPTGAARPDGTIHDPFGFGESDVTTTTSDGYTDVTGVDPFDVGGLSGIVSTGLYRVSEFTTMIYVRTRAIGAVIILPLLAVFLIAGLLLSKSHDSGGKWRKVLRFTFRFVFIAIGIPLLGTMYTGALDDLSVSLTTKAPSSRIIAASFVDFENWAKVSRLDLPEGVNIKSEPVTDTASANAQGQADGESWRTIRNTIYRINYALNLYGLPSDSGLGLSSSGGYALSGGTWDTTTGEFYDRDAFVADVILTGDESTARRLIFNRLNALLSNYSGEMRYTASAWESDVNANMNAQFSACLGSSAASDSSNMHTIYQMYYDSDEARDWLNRYSVHNASIFAELRGVGDFNHVINSDTSSFIGDYNHDTDTIKGRASLAYSSAKWAYEPWNIFSNGTALIDSSLRGSDGKWLTSTGLLTGNDGVSYTHDSRVSMVSPGGSSGLAPVWTCNGMSPGCKGGLSTVAMYNFLCTSFNDSHVAVYSTANATSEYNSEQHYSVNVAGSGFSQTLFLINCIVCLAVFVLIAIYYCFGIVIHNIKTGVSLLMQIPGAMLGVISSIKQVIMYVVAMILELVVTIFLYDFVMDLIVVFASIIEGPVVDMASDIEACSAMGGIFASVFSSNMITSIMQNRELFMVGLAAVIIGLIGFGRFAYKMRRPVLTTLAYLHLRMLRMVTLPQMIPVFDNFAANLNSLYVWDDMRTSMRSVSKAIVDLWHTSPNVVSIDTERSSVK